MTHSYEYWLNFQQCHHCFWFLALLRQIWMYWFVFILIPENHRIDPIFLAHTWCPWPYTFSLLKGYISQTMRIGALGIPAYRTFSLEELEKATNGFETSTFMGEGSHGQVCRALLLAHSTESCAWHSNILRRRIGFVLEFTMLHHRWPTLWSYFSWLLRWHAFQES